MKALRDLEIFVRAAEAQSLSAVARALDLTPAAASAAIKRLEAELETVLFVRSTRHLRLTLEGERFLRHAQQALALLQDAHRELTTGRSLVRGKLRISLPSDLGRNHLLGWLDAFQLQYPALELQLSLTDRVSDIYRQPVDVAIRYGDLPDSALIALPLAPANRRVLCAAPDYLARAGTPRSPQELSGHNCLRFMLSDTVHEQWRFERGKDRIAMTVRGDRVADDGEAVRRWALAGFGIAYKSRLDVAHDLRIGRLIHLCPDWLGEATPLSLLCPGRRRVTPAIKLLQAFLLKRLDAL